MAREAQAIIALGSNLPASDGAPPLVACRRALAAIAEAVGPLAAHSPWYLSEPVPASSQPWFVNGVAVSRTSLAPAAVMAALHGLEEAAGRCRRQRWEARVLDLDLLAYDDQLWDEGEGGLVLPHPRLAERAFVLMPLADVAANWCHPGNGRAVADMLAELPAGQRIARLP
jgi:2-amino-4-hydroxy-6-hydroxymethyldihydropteridine diphosphokinase